MKRFKFLYGGINKITFNKIFNNKVIPLKQRLQQLANRLNYNNNIGNVVGEVSSRFFGDNLSEDLKNNFTIKNSAKAARKDLYNYYQSEEYLNRLKKAKVNLNNKDLLSNKLDSARVYSVDSNTANKLNRDSNSSSGGFRAQTRYKLKIIDGKKYNPGIYYNKGTMVNGLGEGVYGTMAHEFSHWSDRALTPDALKHNHSLIEGNLNPNAGSYLGSDTEIRARGIDILMNYNNNSNKYRDLDDFLDKEGDMKGMIELRKTFKDEKSFRNYMHNFVKNDNTKFDPNIVYYAKNGIHIKKENRGKFTDYCGGKVTSECIAKGKRSSSATIRKRATFAANARKWKHNNGGLILFAEEGTKMNFGLRLGNFLNSDLGKTAINSGLSLFNTYSANNSLEALAQAQKAENELEAANAILKAMEEYLKNRLLKFKLWMSDYLSGKTMDLPSDIVVAHLGYEDFNLLVANIKSGIKLKNTLMDMAVALAKQNNWTSSIGGLLQEGLGTLGNYLSKKNDKDIQQSNSV